MAINDSDKDVAEAAAEKLDDQELLCRVALESPHFRAAWAAIDRITDQDLLFRQQRILAPKPIYLSQRALQ